MSEEQAVDSPVVETTPTAEVSTDQNTEVSATPEPQAETPDTDKPVTDDTPRKPSNSKFDRKIDRLNRAIGEQKARADYLAQQLEAAQPKPQAPSDGMAFDKDGEAYGWDVEKYAEAKAKKAGEDALKRYGDEQQAQTQKQAEAQLTKSWESKTSRAESKYDDFDEVVGDLTPTSPINIAIMQAENGEDIAHYLGKNLQEAHRIANLDLISAVREIGRLEAKLLAEPPKAKTPSNAPAPITPVKGSSSANKTIFDDGLSQTEWEKVRNAQLKRK